jgi:transcriptional regulator with XRE-family HTH domain
MAIMAKTIAPLLPATTERLQQLGNRLHLARRRRGLTAIQVAERAGMSRMTLRSLERGGSGVTMGAYLAVMQVLGLERDLDLIASADPVGRELQDAGLPTHKKRTTRIEPPPVANASQNAKALQRDDTHRVAPERKHGGGSLSTRSRTADPAREAQKLLEQLDDARRVVEEQKHMREVLESLDRPTQEVQKLLGQTDVARRIVEEQKRMGEALESLTGSTKQLEWLLGQTDATRRMIEEQKRVSESLKSLTASPKAVQKLLQQTEDTRRWIETSGFADSKKLADLIDLTKPGSKSRG